MDDAQLVFKILSMTITNCWYNISIKCSYCDCPDLASKCKHLMGIRLIIERCLPELSNSLPFIDHVVNMHNIDETSNEVVSIDVDMNATPLEVAKWKYEISNLKETIRVFENSLQSINLVVVQGCIEQVTSLNKMLSGVIAPTFVNMPQRGSIKGLQQNVTLNRLGGEKHLSMQMFLLFPKQRQMIHREIPKSCSSC